MKTIKILFSVAITLFILTGCKNEVKKETLPADKQSVSLAISGMTCEIGCAKTIESKLSKKEGVLNAKVTFNDSIAKVEFDANTTSKKDLIAFVDGIAGGKLYKASENKVNCTNKKDCKADKKSDTNKTTCKEGDKKMNCTADKKDDKKTACKVECCANKKAA